MIPKKTLHTRRKEVESISLLLSFSIWNDNSVTGIVTTCTSSTDIGIRSENIDKFAFAFVTPLGAKADTLENIFMYT